MLRDGETGWRAVNGNRMRQGEWMARTEVNGFSVEGDGFQML